MIRKRLSQSLYIILKKYFKFSLNKCVADIYTLFNYLEKKKIYLCDSDLSRKILMCLYPIMPRMSSNIMLSLFNENIKYWPSVNSDLLIETDINLPIQIHGKLVTTIKTMKGYEEKEILKLVYKMDKIKNKILDRKVIKVINVQDKIINIITN